MQHHIAISIAGQSPETERLTNTHPLGGISPADPPRSLYIHIPFCFHKCHYCDFYSIVDTRDRQEAFAARLIAELAAIAPLAGPLKTIFVGGGTPTLLRPDLWGELLAALETHFDLATIHTGGEFSVECNPETATSELFAILQAGGVGRISIGAQSFNPVHLKALERWHEPDNVGRAIQLARDAGIDRQSIDLIFAIPGQTLDDLARDLDIALGLGVGHLSCYNLTYESNTPMTRRLQRGEFEPADEDLEIAMQDLIVDHCSAAGLERYEISNFARPGQECAHNLAYWRQEQWLAAGPSASGHVCGWRWKNVPRLGDYLAGGGLPPAVDIESPDPSRALAERLMTGLRLREGVPWNEIERAAAALDGRVRDAIDGVRASLESRGLIETHGDRVVASESGLRFADLIAREFLGVLT